MKNENIENRIRDEIRKFGKEDFSMTIVFGKEGNGNGRTKEISRESGRDPYGQRKNTVQ